MFKISGTINNHYQNEEILKKALESGATNAAIMSREVHVECPLNKLEILKNTLKEMRISDIRVKEAQLVETTVMQSGSGEDPKKAVKVNLAPATKMSNRKLLTVVLAEGVMVDDSKTPEFINKSKEIINKILSRAGVTHCLVSVEVNKNVKDFEYSLELATISALVNTNGIIQL